MCVPCACAAVNQGRSLPSTLLAYETPCLMFSEIVSCHLSMPLSMMAILILRCGSRNSGLSVSFFSIDSRNLWILAKVPKKLHVRGISIRVILMVYTYQCKTHTVRSQSCPQMSHKRLADAPPRQLRRF